MAQRLALWVELPTDPRYWISSEGVICRVTPGKGTWVGRETYGAKRADGYLQVFRFAAFNMMHQAVASAFLGPCPPGMEVNHKNGIRSDARAHNLEYVTRKENILHGIYELNLSKLDQRREQARVNGRKCKRGWKKSNAVRGVR